MPAPTGLIDQSPWVVPPDIDPDRLKSINPVLQIASIGSTFVKAAWFTVMLCDAVVLPQ